MALYQANQSPENNNALAENDQKRNFKIRFIWQETNAQNYGFKKQILEYTRC